VLAVWRDGSCDGTVLDSWLPRAALKALELHAEGVAQVPGLQYKLGRWLVGVRQTGQCNGP
jgi:hypothetical protein